ncbi:MAG: hypothetical protein ACLP19_27180 [Xanthobacteraceae bacterium]
MSDNLDFNNAGEQRSLDVIPANTICTLQMTVRPGAVGDGGWLTRSSDGASEGLDCEFTVVNGQFAKRKLWQRLTLRGTTPGHETAGEIPRNMLRAILESARGIKPDDKSEAAQTARKAASWGDFNNLRFVARIGVRPPKDGYAAKNTILEVITPERTAWKKPEQVAQAASTGAATPAATPPAGAVTRPQWAE